MLWYEVGKQVMIKVEKKGKSQAKSRNRVRVFNYIWEKQNVTRMQISSSLKISAPSVTRIIEDLISQGYVKEVGAKDVAMGRKPIRLSIVDSALYSIGISLSKTYLNIVLVNLGRKMVYHKRYTVNIKDMQELCLMMKHAIDNLLNETNIELDKIAGIGIGTTGVVDTQRGVLEVYESKVKIFDIPIKEYLYKIYKLKVILDNNINVLLLGEYWYSEHNNIQGRQNIALIYCSDGIGSSYLIDGNINRGHNGFAGKIGHMTVQQEGRRCLCGNKGCLEAYTSRFSIEERFFEKTSEQKTLVEICELANDRHKEAEAVICSALDYIAVAVNNINLTLNPEELIFAGEIFEYYSNALDYTRLKVESHSFHRKLNEVKWRLKKKMVNQIEIDATAMVISQLFDIG